MGPIVDASAFQSSQQFVHFFDIWESEWDAKKKGGGTASRISGVEFGVRESHRVLEDVVKSFVIGRAGGF
eukprot:1250400-Amphidinium_carterae.1